MKNLKTILALRYSLFALFFLLSTFLLLTSCHNKSKDNILIAPLIEYDMTINNKDPELDWWNKNIEGSKRDAFLNKIYDDIISGKLKAYLNNPTLKGGVEDSPLSADKVRETLKINAILSNADFTHIDKIRFREKWLINKNNAEIEKTVFAFCPLVLKDSTYIPLFWIKTDTTNTDKNPAPVSERIQYDVSIKTPNSDWWVENIETSKRTNLIDIIVNTAYSAKTGLFDYFNEPLSSVQLKKELNRIDTFRIPNQANNKDTLIIVRKELEKEKINKLRFMEEWYIGQKSFSFTKKVVGINPILEVFDAIGAFKGNRPLFWIYFDAKYPAALIKK